MVGKLHVCHDHELRLGILPTIPKCIEQPTPPNGQPQMTAHQWLIENSCNATQQWSVVTNSLTIFSLSNASKCIWYYSKMKCALVIVIFPEEGTTVLPVKNFTPLHSIHLNENLVFSQTPGKSLGISAKWLRWQQKWLMDMDIFN